MIVDKDHEQVQQRFIEELKQRNPGEDEFHQAVSEVATHIIPFIGEHPEYGEKKILERLAEPDRVIMFRVCWEDDDGCIQVNRGYRVQCNNAIGPYKGGIRFHPSVNLSILKFLAFEQTFKNSLTGLPLGGGKGGSDFDPKGKSEAEVMRFCKAFMTELARYIGPNLDVPAGDIGVGSREIGFLFGQYKRMTHRFEGVLTGKALEFGGSHIRREATGYGVVYMMQNMLARCDQQIAGKTCVVSGAGNVSTHCVAKLIELDAKVVAMSDSTGFIHDADGIDEDKLAWIQELKQEPKGSLREYADRYDCTFNEGTPWGIETDLAFPCATQNELDGDDARKLIDNGCKAIAEGANMPTTPEAMKCFHQAGLLHAPAKAANAGGVAVSGLEMSQNSVRTRWSAEEVDERLRAVMDTIHEQCLEYGQCDGRVDYIKGANLAGFRKVADAMLAYGVD
ncbi:MAG: NADP-specific glutamate dehydrogenase [Wenzhouxiangellaceae bacterium]